MQMILQGLADAPPENSAAMQKKADTERQIKGLKALLEKEE